MSKKRYCYWSYSLIDTVSNALLIGDYVDYVAKHIPDCKPIVSTFKKKHNDTNYLLVHFKMSIDDTQTQYDVLRFMLDNDLIAKDEYSRYNDISLLFNKTKKYESIKSRIFRKASYFVSLNTGKPKWMKIKP